ncbi:MAG: hypothetical protein GX468_06455, partial [Thermotogaceae bacterium]|nr:hypothetical protein [Thermotogaceae bacterium]
MREKIVGIVIFLLAFLIVSISFAQQVPKAPSDFKAETLPSLTEVKLTWKDNSTDEDGFRIMRSVDGIDWEQIAVVEKNTTQFIDKGLTSKTTYYYKLHAYNAYGRSENALTKGFTSLVPPQPTSLVASLVNGVIKLSWKDESNYETKYMIERKIGNSEWQEIAKVPENATEFIDKDISIYGTTYYYRIYTENELGKSLSSPVASIFVNQIKQNTILIATNEGVALYDVSEPSVPIFLVLVEMKNAQSAFTYNNYAYVADGEYGITIIDIADPQTPFKITSFDTPGFAYSVYVKDNIAYVADGEKGLVIIDVSNVQKPNQLSIVDTPGLACGIYVQDNYAYIADEKNG